MANLRNLSYWVKFKNVPYIYRSEVTSRYFTFFEVLSRQHVKELTKMSCNDSSKRLLKIVCRYAKFSIKIFHVVKSIELYNTQNDLSRRHQSVDL